MQVLKVDEPIHWCDECERFFKGRVESKSRLADTYEAGTLLEHVSLETIYLCRDPRGACHLQEDEFEQYEEGWMCGACGRLQADMSEAIDCCQ